MNPFKLLFLFCSKANALSNNSENLLPKITAVVLQTKSQVSGKVLDKYLNNENRENYIKSAIVNLMSTPEYQLC